MNETQHARTQGVGHMTLVLLGTCPHSVRLHVVFSAQHRGVCA